MQLLLLSDTHLPRRARDLPPQVWQEAERADLIVHAGDWVQVGLLDDLEALAPVLGCVGNNDGWDLRDRLPELATATVEGVRFAVVHDTGPSTGRDERMAARYPDVDVLVFGHSHIPWDAVAASTGLRLLNPGSPTDRRRQPHCTYMTATVQDGTLSAVTLHEL